MRIGDRKPPRAQAPAGSAVKSGATDRVKGSNEVRANAPARNVADAVARATHFDATDHLPLHAGLAVASADVTRAADALDKVASAVADADAGAVLLKAASAARTAAGLGATGAPATVVLKEDPKRPSTLEGFVDRRTRGSGANAHLSVLFRPKNKDIQPFPLDAAMVEGLPSGALVKLKLARKERGQEAFVLQAAEGEYARSMVANVVVDGGTAWAVGRGVLTPYVRVPLEGADASQLAGSSVVVDIRDGATPERRAVVREVLGKEAAAKATFFQIASEAGSSLDFPPDVMAEIAAIKADPQITGTDLTSIPFVTIDYETSKDLDQAVALVKRPDGNLDVHYAIADAAHFVKEGSAIDREARRRGLTTYLPGARSLPVLPPELSEDLCSLVANQKRRAFVVTVTVDPEGQPLETRFQRGVIQSRAKLAYNGVQAFHDSGFEGPLAGKEYSESLKLLEGFGKARIAECIKRGVVPSGEGKLEIRANGDATAFEIAKTTRNEVEKWNEQVSLLVNEQVGKFLVESGARVLHRVHMPPDPAKVDAFRARVGALGLPWLPSVELDDYIRDLDPDDARTQTVQRWATRINKAAIYSTEPLGHSALKLGAYDHFTAPMRRYPDIVVHRVLSALVEHRAVPHQQGDDLERIGNRMESARRRTGDVSGRCRAYMTAAMLAPLVGEPLKGRILDVTPSSVVVALESPEVEVEIPVSALNQAAPGPGHALTRGGIAVEGPTGVYEVGKDLEVVVTLADPAAERVVAMPAAFHDPVPKAA